MSRELILVDRRRTVIGIVVLLIALVAVLVILVHVQGRAVESEGNAAITTALETAAGITIAAIVLVVATSLAMYRRSVRLRRVLRRAIHRDRTWAYGGRSDAFSEFGELGAAIGAYGRALESRSRAIVRRLGATEQAIRRVVATVEEDILVLDGAGRVFASSPSAQRLIRNDEDGTPRVISDPPMPTTLRSFLSESPRETVLVEKTKLYLSPVFMVGPEGDRFLTFLILMRREAAKSLPSEVRPTQTRDRGTTGIIGTVLGRFRAGRERR